VLQTDFLFWLPAVPMVVTSESSNLAAIPESISVSYQPTSVRTSPRSTSDSPGRSPPISQHSRLLQPTLSWKAKAGWIPNPVAGTSTAAADQLADTSSTQVQVSMAAVSARNQAMAAGRRTSLISPSTSFHVRDEPQQIAAAGEQLCYCRPGSRDALLSVVIHTILCTS